MDRAQKEFVRLSSEAFTKRTFADIPFLRELSTFMHGFSIYKTRPLHQALKKALGVAPFFGSNTHELGHTTTKVAVTSTADEGRRAMLLANYNRRDEEARKRGSRSDGGYRFLRPHDPSEELTIYEAAAATSAATPFFKPFYHPQSWRHFWDGAFYNNNPAEVAHKEMALLWPDVTNRPPDIFLSIGTSQHKRNIDWEIDSIRRDDLSQEM